MMMTDREAKTAAEMGMPYLKNVADGYGSFYVLPDRSGRHQSVPCYQVVGGIAHSQAVDSAYELSPDGLSIAIARVNYLAQRYQSALDIQGWIYRVNKRSA